MIEPTFTPRPSQQVIIDVLLNADGPVRLGVSAVPGSGKTHILSFLASELVQRVEDDQEVLIVTLVNAAVDNFRRRVEGLVRERGLLPGFNYRVCTLHSLAHEIVQQRPSLVGLSQDLILSMIAPPSSSCGRWSIAGWRLTLNWSIFICYLTSTSSRLCAGCCPN